MLIQFYIQQYSLLVIDGIKVLRFERVLVAATLQIYIGKC
jgi:hypothetical protein